MSYRRVRVPLEDKTSCAGGAGPSHTPGQEANSHEESDISLEVCAVDGVVRRRQLDGTVRSSAGSR